MKILLTGLDGQLGKQLQPLLEPLGNLTTVGRETLDLANPDNIYRVIEEIKPEIIVNAAAYTAVDKSESEVELATAVNGTAPGILAAEAEKLGATLIHISTDYVFDGSSSVPYLE
ncbi:MAG: sugar nucleotide-binding protein, partial [Okeania sp. SIO2H7]|nr:sugar nucleotide-binding protein [Okeania sp. SIO2H7]